MVATNVYSAKKLETTEVTKSGAFVNLLNKLGDGLDKIETSNAQFSETAASLNEELNAIKLKLRDFELANKDPIFTNKEVQSIVSIIRLVVLFFGIAHLAPIFESVGAVLIKEYGNLVRESGNVDIKLAEINKDKSVAEGNVILEAKKCELECKKEEVNIIDGEKNLKKLKIQGN